MTNSTHLYGQLFNHLRQHSRACDLRHLKALAWMVSALLCSEELNLAAWEPYIRASSDESAKRRAALATVHGEWANFRHGNLHTVSAGSLEQVEVTTIVFSFRYDCAVGSFLHDPPVGGLLWSSRSLIVAGTRT